MSQRSGSIVQYEFGGVVTAGHPLQRPAASAASANNIRFMPGGWMCLRGGRKAKLLNSGEIKQIYEFRRSEAGGGIYHVVRRNDGLERWSSLDLSTFGLTDLEVTASTTGNQAVTTVRSRLFMFNGLGQRTSDSRPALSSWDGTRVRYVGLDAFAGGGRSASFFDDPVSGKCSVLYKRTFYVGLHNTGTGHFSNGVLLGSVSVTTPGTPRIGDITVSGLNQLTHAYHDVNEQAELKFVLYCTVDGGSVPYLVMDSTGLNPLMLSPVTASFSFNLNNSTSLGGYTIDQTVEMPTENFPPRQMSEIVYANGRIYGVLQPGGAGGDNNFSYVVPDRDLAAVVWSAAADDTVDRDFVGVPEESWPLLNKKYTINGEKPLVLAPGNNRNQVLVITRGGTYFLEETADGLHDWYTISPTDGIANKSTFVMTSRGPMWVTQNNQIVLLPIGAESLTVVSDAYSDLLRPFWAEFTCSDHLKDPQNWIDRYQVWLSDGSSIIHDFAIGGQGYSYTNPGGVYYRAARTVTDSTGRRFHLCSDGTHLYAQEADPATGIIPLTDQTGAGAFSEINGEMIGQWQDFSDRTVRKEFFAIDVVGDAAYSAYLNGRAPGGDNQGGDFVDADGNVVKGSPLIVTWYRDLVGVERSVSMKKTPQSETDFNYQGKVKDAGNAFWIKIRIKIRGHSSEASSYYRPVGGDIAPFFYGAVMSLGLAVSDRSSNRSN